MEVWVVPPWTALPSWAALFSPPPYPRGAAAVVALATGVVAVGAVSEWVAWFTWTVLSFPPPPPLLAS